MDCEQALNLISAEVDGEIDEPDRTKLAAHLDDCSACREAHDQVREQDAELRRAFGPLRDKALTVSSYVESALPGLDTPAPRSTRTRVLQLCAAAAAGFVVSVLVFQPWRWPEAPPPIADRAPPATPSAPADAARLEVAAGPIEVLRPGADAWTALERGDPIAPGTRVRTSADSRCELSTIDGSTVRLNQDTVLLVQNHRDFELDRGQVWATVARGETSFRVDVPSAGTAVTALGTQFDLRTRLNEAFVTVVEGSTRVEGLGPDDVLEQGEMAHVVDGRLERRSRVRDLVLATSWVHELLVLKGREDRELSARVGELFAQIGKTKMSLLAEEEIRSLGDHCVLPLRSYLLSAESRREPGRRALAARILSDVTQPWFIPEFIDLLTDEDSNVRYHAAAGLERLTRRDLGKSAEAWRDMPENERELNHILWRRWWEDNRDRYPGGPSHPRPPQLKARALK